MVKEDILAHFNKAIQFIEDALEAKHKILVHWYYILKHTPFHLLFIILIVNNFSYFGVSRSAAIIIAFIMKKYSLSFTPAFERYNFKNNNIVRIIKKTSF